MRKIGEIILAIGVCTGFMFGLPSSGTVRAVGSIEKEEDSVMQEKPELYIKAFNPGYTIDGKRDVGEFIELAKEYDDELILSGYELKYINISGTEISLYEFLENAVMQEDNLVLRLEKVAETDSYDATYSTSLALSAGPLLLLKEGEIIDQVCWNGKDGCYQGFQSKNPTTLVRIGQDEDTSHEQAWEEIDFIHTKDYQPEFKRSLVIIDEAKDELTEEVSACRQLQITEVYSYYESDPAEQFIEILNLSEIDIDLKDCRLVYRNKTYSLSGIVKQGDFGVIWPYVYGFALTKNPSSKNSILIKDSDDNVITRVEYPKGQKKATSYAMILSELGEETWLQTYRRTPGEVNIYQEYRNCLIGYVINPVTGNCIKEIVSSTKICPAGQELNPLTNRCRKITEAAEKTCQEGYELNPLTNRCRKKRSENTGVEYALVPETYSGEKKFVATGIILAIISAGILYIIWQFRRDFARVYRKVRHMRKKG